MKKYNFGIIGCGNMSQAILRAMSDETNKYFLKKGGAKFTLNVSDKDSEKFKDLDANIVTYTDNQQLCDNCDIIMLAIKPQMFDMVTQGLNLKDKLVISIMAGVSIEKIKSCAEKIVRVMPNLNARVGASFNAYSTYNISEEEEDALKLILSSFGEPFKTEESNLNSVTGICGSGPAFVFMFVKAFIDSAINKGFSPIVARNMALSTIIGSCYLVEKEQETEIENLINSVCSKGGTTIEGVNHLKESNFEKIVSEAIEKAIIRAGELEKL